MPEHDSLFIGQDEDVQTRRVMFEQDSDSDTEVDYDKRDGGEASSSEGAEDDLEDGIVYCVCRKAEHGFMVGCDGGCEDWFHGDCVGIEEKDKDALKQFICPACAVKSGAVTTWMDGNELGRVESDRVVSGANDVLRNHPTSHKGPVQSLAAEHHKKRITRSNVRAGDTVRQHKPLRRAPVTHQIPVSRQEEIARKLQRSLPTFDLGAVAPPTNAAHGATAGDFANSDIDMDTVRPGSGIDSHEVTVTVTVKRRTYVDVEEAPTFVDVLVKSSLEQALFGPWEV